MERPPRDAWFRWAQVLFGSVALFTALGFFAPAFLLAELVVHFKVFYLLGSALAAGVFAVRRKVRWCVFAIVLTAFHVPGVFIWYVPANGSADESGTPVRIVTANLLVSNKHHDRFLKFIRKTDPDIIFIQELNNSWANSLDLLKETYPYHAVEPRADSFGIALFSRLPLDPTKITYYGNSDVPSVHAELRLNGRHLSVLSYHTLPPVSPNYLAARDEGLLYLPKYAADAEDLVVVAGDLNVTPWTPVYKTMIRDSGLKNARRGYGIKPTWWSIPSPISLLPLDHVLVSPEIIVDDFRLGPPIGSDHRPVIVDLRIPAKRAE